MSPSHQQLRFDRRETPPSSSHVWQAVQAHASSPVAFNTMKRSGPRLFTGYAPLDSMPNQHVHMG